MPILDVDKAKTVVMIKRSLSPGFAGIPNPLFAAENCLMLFGDGKKALMELNAALKVILADGTYWAAKERGLLERWGDLDGK